jgi:hypothetical protein
LPHAWSRFIWGEIPPPVPVRPFLVSSICVCAASWVRITGWFSKCSDTDFAPT